MEQTVWYLKHPIHQKVVKEMLHLPWPVFLVPTTIPFDQGLEGSRVKQDKCQGAAVQKRAQGTPWWRMRFRIHYYVIAVAQVAAVARIRPGPGISACHGRGQKEREREKRAGFSHNNLYFYYFFSGCACGIWEFPGHGLNLSCSCDLHHSCSNARSLTHYTTVGTPHITLFTSLSLAEVRDKFFSLRLEHL